MRICMLNLKHESMCMAPQALIILNTKSVHKVCNAYRWCKAMVFSVDPPIFSKYSLQKYNSITFSPQMLPQLGLVITSLSAKKSINFTHPFLPNIRLNILHKMHKVCNAQRWCTLPIFFVLLSSKVQLK